MKDRIFIGAILGALVLLSALAIVLLDIGRHHPSPPSLRDNPNPAIPGQIAYVDEDSCIIIADASGESRRELLCRDSVGQITWLDANTIGYVSFTGSAPVLVRVDIATGVETFTANSLVIDGPDFESPLGERLIVEYGGEILVVGTDGRPRQIREFDVPDHRSPYLVTWSPDGEWILLGYDGGELWILSRDGSFAGTLTKDVRWEASWHIPGSGTLPSAQLIENPR